MMDARRNQVYTGLYGYEGSRLITYEKPDALPVTEILEKINQNGESVIFLGDGVPVYKNQIEEMVKVPFRYAPPHLNRQRAGAVGTLAVQYFQEGKMESARDHKPDYLRKSQAERELLEKQKAGQI